MAKQVRWLLEQVEGWKAQGLISAEQAERIRRLYPEPQPGLPWGLIIFSGLGAVVGGLGVTLLVARNWQAIPKFGKLAIVFGTLIGVHGIGVWLSGRTDWRRQLGEAICLLGSMLFGAGIWLVAQIYNIEEHYPTGFLLWGVGALAMAWALPSVAQGLLATVVLCIWGCSEAWHFEMAEHWSPIVILLGVGGLAWRVRSRLLLFVGMGAFLATVLSNTGDIQGQIVVPVLVSTSALLAAASFLVRRQRWFPGSAPVWGFWGWAGFLVGVFLLCFADATYELLGLHQGPRYEADKVAFIIYGWGPFALALAAWGVVAWRCRPGLRTEERITECTFEHWLLPLTMVVAQVMGASNVAERGWVSAGPFNLVFLGLAMTWIRRGCREGILAQTMLGSVLLVALTLARYFDLFESLAARGLVFLIVGGILFAEGIFYRRARQRAEAEGKA
jgi:uncharacterized membrane protein